MHLRRSRFQSRQVPDVSNSYIISRGGVRPFWIPDPPTSGQFNPVLLGQRPKSTLYAMGAYSQSSEATPMETQGSREDRNAL